MAKASTRWSGMDLLEEQRQALGIGPPQRPAASLVLLRGTAVGLVLMVVVAALGMVVTRERLAWTRQVEALAPEARKHDQLQAQLQQSQHHLAQLRQSNGALVQALTAHRPHSLLLMELAARTPPGVQLLELNGAPDGITLKGQAESWPLVNLLQLRLQASPLFQQGAGVQVKGLRQTGATGATKLDEIPTHSPLPAPILAPTAAPTSTVGSPWPGAATPSIGGPWAFAPCATSHHRR